MLKYLIIPLSEDAVSFCHYEPSCLKKTISQEILNNGILWAMKENVSVQFLYPTWTLPEEILETTESIEHINIMPFDIDNKSLLSKADIIVVNTPTNLMDIDFHIDKTYVLRTELSLLLESSEPIKEVLRKVKRLNIVITDVDSFDDRLLSAYSEFLTGLIPIITQEFRQEHNVQLNLLTDRIMLDGMNNCNAGTELLTLAPDGKFYACPAFYLTGDKSVGDLDKGLDIRNPKLYKLAYAPICRSCDAYQCRRCVWLNKKLTLEINTPSRQQCIISHIERNASRVLLGALGALDSAWVEDKTIPEIDYLDPFDKIVNKK